MDRIKPCNTRSVSSSNISASSDFSKKSKLTRNLQLSHQLKQRPARHPTPPQEFSIAAAPKPLSDIRKHRDCRPPHLRSQSILLGIGHPRRLRIHHLRQSLRPLPSNQIPKRPNTHKSPPPRTTFCPHLLVFLPSLRHFVTLLHFPPLIIAFLFAINAANVGPKNSCVLTL